MMFDLNYFDEKYKTTDLDAVMPLKEYLPRYLTVFHIKGRQDNNISYLLTIS